MIYVKIHQTSTRRVVAVCDADLIGKKFEQGKRQLNVTMDFFQGREMSEDEAIQILKKELEDDSCFNFIGSKAINAGVKAEVLVKEHIMKVQDVPYAMALL